MFLRFLRIRGWSLIHFHFGNQRVSEKSLSLRVLKTSGTLPGGIGDRCVGGDWRLGCVMEWI